MLISLFQDGIALESGFKVWAVYTNQEGFEQSFKRQQKVVFKKYKICVAIVEKRENLWWNAKND